VYKNLETRFQARTSSFFNNTRDGNCSKKLEIEINFLEIVLKKLEMEINFLETVVLSLNIYF
jgi:hypothetical protein